jgi:hypothetical protein
MVGLQAVSRFFACPGMRDALPRQDIYTLKSVDLRQFLQQRSGFLEVSSVKALGAPAVYLR